MLKVKFKRLLSLFTAAAVLAVCVPVSAIFSAETGADTENVLTTMLQKAEAIVRYESGNIAYEQLISEDKFAAMTDGNTSDHIDLPETASWNPPRKLGTQFTLIGAVKVEEIKLYASIPNYPETYSIYASDALETLYSDENCLTDAQSADPASAVTVKANKEVKYIAFICESFSGNPRFKEIEAWKAEGENEFVSENLFAGERLENKEEIIFDSLNNTASVGARFNSNGALDISTDGNTVEPRDVYAYEPNSTYWIGARFTLDGTYYSEKLVIYAGFDNLRDYYRVYASDSLENLYSAENMVAGALECDGGGQEIKLNKNIKYVSVICDNITAAANGRDTIFRVKEFELWSGDPSEAPEDPDAPFISENVLRTKLNSSKTVARPAGGGTVFEQTHFDGGSNKTSEKAVDGDISTPYDAWGALDWDTPTQTGVVYTLNDAVYCGTVKIYSGFENMPDYFDIYASDNIDNLYSDENRIASSVKCADGEVEVKVEKQVQYIAFFLVDYSGNGRVREFELWSAEKKEDTKPTKKVLTIGNSFAENASAYASAIAAAQGCELMFGYIKYPSCTIAQHVSNAKNNKAVYKFEYTDSSGRHLIKTGEDGNCAAIREALEYTDWDIVVLQEGSTASEKFENFSQLTELIDIVKNTLPAADIMLHETWSWGVWDDVKEKIELEDDDGNIAAEEIDVRCYNIMSNYFLASKLYANGAGIIHSGMAIELARDYYGDHHMFNDYDGGNYQHLNELGKYIAGAMYVATIFGDDFTANTYGDGAEIFAALDLPEMREMIEFVSKYADVLLEDIFSELFKSNFIRSHIESVSTIIQNVNLLGNINGITEHDRFSAADKDAVEKSIDGDTLNYFEVWGALDWEDNPNNVGIRYGLDGLYSVESAIIYAGQPGNTNYFDVYASDSPTNLYDLKNRVATGVACSGQGVEVPVGKNVKYVAFIITGYTGSAHIAEFDLVASEVKQEIEPIVWPDAPNGTNLLKLAAASKIIAPGGDYNGTKEFDYGFMDGQTASDLKYLTDGDLSKHYDIWSLGGNDKPGVLYDLGRYYDISHLHAWAGAYGSELLVVNGFRVYASDSLSTLYRKENMVFSYHNGDDTTNEMGVDTQLKRVRYIAFILTDTVDGGWRMREFAAYGRLSSDQTEAVEQKSIIEGLDAEYYGVATDNLADPVYMGASNFVAALTDGSRDSVEFWGGSDIENSKFVFIYNLYGNYDLTGADIFAFADSIEEDSGIHKGIRSAKVYASRNLESLFNSNPVVVKEDYENPSKPDETAFYSAEAPSAWKSARYVAFVFTIGDSRYGACRLEELKVYGTLSAVQDEEPEEEKLPQYIDITAENGVVARIFAIDGRDDLSKLDANLKAERKTGEKDLSPVNSALKGFTASELYDIDVLNGTGEKVELGGRLIRLSIPGDPESKVACVDGYGAEIISNGTLGDKLTVETETLRDYALVTQSKTAGGLAGGADVLMIVTVCLGVLAGCGIAVTVLFGIKARKNKF